MNQNKKTAKKTVGNSTKLAEKYTILDKSDYKDGELYLPGTALLFDTQEAAIEYMAEEDESLIEISMLCRVVPVGSFKRNVNITLEKI